MIQLKSVRLINIGDVTLTDRLALTELDRNFVLLSNNFAVKIAVDAILSRIKACDVTIALTEEIIVKNIPYFSTLAFKIVEQLILYGICLFSIDETRNKLPTILCIEEYILYITSDQEYLLEKKRKNLIEQTRPTNNMNYYLLICNEPSTTGRLNNPLSSITNKIHDICELERYYMTEEKYRCEPLIYLEKDNNGSSSFDAMNVVADATDGLVQAVRNETINEKKYINSAENERLLNRLRRIPDAYKISGFSSYLSNNYNQGKSYLTYLKDTLLVETCLLIGVPMNTAKISNRDDLKYQEDRWEIELCVYRKYAQNGLSHIICKYFDDVFDDYRPIITLGNILPISRILNLIEQNLLKSDTVKEVFEQYGITASLQPTTPPKLKKEQKKKEE